MSVGRLFHTLGAATANALSPNLLRGSKPSTFFSLSIPLKRFAPSHQILVTPLCAHPTPEVEEAWVSEWSIVRRQLWGTWPPPFPRFQPIYIFSSLQNCTKSDGDFAWLSLSKHFTVCDGSCCSLMMAIREYISCRFWSGIYFHLGRDFPRYSTKLCRGHCLPCRR